MNGATVVNFAKSSAVHPLNLCFEKLTCVSLIEGTRPSFISTAQLTSARACESSFLFLLSKQSIYLQFLMMNFVPSHPIYGFQPLSLRAMHA